MVNRTTIHWTTTPLLSIIMVISVAEWGCGTTSEQRKLRPFFQTQYDVGSHGRKTGFDRLVETDPGGFDVMVAPGYLKNPPLRIAVLPFADLGSANLVVDKIPLTFRNHNERANWAWTDSQRLRLAIQGYMAEREFVTMNPIAIDAVLRAHGVINYAELEKIPPEEIGRWLDVDAVVYGEVTHYEAYYFLLLSAWRVGINIRMVSTTDGRPLIVADGGRYDVNLMPAVDLLDMAINSGVTLVQLRDINLARAEEEVCREVVTRIPVSSILEGRIAAKALATDEAQKGSIRFAQSVNSLPP